MFMTSGPTHRSMTRRCTLHLLLVLMLVFTQHMGSMHLSAHAAANIAQHQPVVAKNTLQACEQCSLFAALGSSPLQTPFTFDVEPPREHVVALPTYAFGSHSQTFYRSRAPPALS
jgi:hypothetical protein